MQIAGLDGWESDDWEPVTTVKFLEKITHELQILRRAKTITFVRCTSKGGEVRDTQCYDML